MKAKVIETGEIVDVYHEPQHGQKTNIFKEAVLVNGRTWQEDELEFEQNTMLSASDRGIIDEIIFALNALGKEKMISYSKEIEFLNKIRKL